MKTNLIVKMVLILYVLLFSACSKTVYLSCEAEEPQRTYHKQCGNEQNITKLYQCASERFILLESDYEILKTRFRSCK